MWYQAGFAGQMAYATSKDGINWELPALSGGDGSNIFLRQVNRIAGSGVWMDLNADPSERYKMLIRQSDKLVANGNDMESSHTPAKLYVSADGVRWIAAGESGNLGDRSTFFFNELLNKWVFSIRYNTLASWGNQTKSWTRTRLYHEGSTWLEAAKWDWFSKGGDTPKFWLKADTKDPIDQSQGNDAPQIYNFDAICYESITLGLCQIWYGPENGVIEQSNKTKITEIQAAFSRDGYYFDRPLRGAGNALIPASKEDGTWDYGYLSTTMGGVVVYDDEIRIYYSAISNKHTNAYGETVRGPYVGGSIGYATLRRDGFASMNGSGELITKPLTVTKDTKYLFVNADVSSGSLKAEILDPDGYVLAGYTAEDCVAMSTDSCCSKITWKGAEDLSFLENKGFRIRFLMENGELYSFWLSADPEGASGGAMAAGYAGEKELNPSLDDTSSTTEPTDSAEKKSGCRSMAEGSLALILPVLVCLTTKKRKHICSKKA